MSVKSVTLAAILLCASGAASAAPGQFSLFGEDTREARPAATNRTPSTPGALFRLDAPAPEPVAPQVSDENAVDERALRFFAARGETARVAAEIARLRARHPEWQPPRDLFEPGRDDAREARLWPLLEARAFDEIRRAVAAIRTEMPDWRPSELFAERFEEAAATTAIREASEARAFARVVSLAQDAPRILSCRNVDTLWRLAEALLETGDPRRAEEAYAFVLSTCTDAGERIATMQKAAQRLEPSALDRLVGADPAREREFEGVFYDALLARVGERIGEGRAGFVSASDLERLERKATARNDATGFEILGWHAYVVARDFVRAEGMFSRAAAIERRPKAIEGRILALREQGRLEEAEQLAYEWRDEDPLVAKIYLEIVSEILTRPSVIDFPQARLVRFASVVETERSALGARALGWLAFKQEEMAEARRWFSTARAIEEDEEALVGLAMSAHHEGDRAAVAALAERYGGRYPRLVEIAAWSAPAPREPRRATDDGGSAAARNVVALHRAGRYAEAVAAIDASPILSRDHGMQVLRGWALLEQNRHEEAYRQFQRADAQRRTTDTLYGKHWTLERMFGAGGEGAQSFFSRDAFVRRMEREAGR